MPPAGIRAAAAAAAVMPWVPAASKHAFPESTSRSATATIARAASAATGIFHHNQETPVFCYLQPPFRMFCDGRGISGLVPPFLWGLRKRGNDISKSTGRSGRQNAATRRNMRREERVTVQGHVKEQQPDGMSYRGLERVGPNPFEKQRLRGGRVRLWPCAPFCHAQELKAAATKSKDVSSVESDSPPASDDGFSKAGRDRVGTAAERDMVCRRLVARKGRLPARCV